MWCIDGYDGRLGFRKKKCIRNDWKWGDWGGWKKDNYWRRSEGYSNKKWGMEKRREIRGIGKGKDRGGNRN